VNGLIISALLQTNRIHNKSTTNKRIETEQHPSTHAPSAEHTKK
jgi:hypothetical protein